MKKTFLIIFIILWSLLISYESDVVFDDSQVLTFGLEFEQPDFLDLLWANYLAGENEYIPATFTFEEEVYDSVGVRYKGNASAFSTGIKKPFKIKFNQYIENQEFYGITKLSLSNEFEDPSFLREKYLYDVFNKYVPSGRANHVKLLTNREYLGLYTNVEQVDSRLMKRLFGENEGGNLFKGDPMGTLEWYGPGHENYYPWYELKTNEDINDWTDLVNLIDVLNNGEDILFPETIESIFHWYPWMATHAINNIFVNFDSYVGKGHNYYLYHRTDTDRFTHIPWDLNYSFATYGAGAVGSGTDVPIDYPGETAGTRPLCERIFEFDEYEELYLMVYDYIFEHEFHPDVIYTRITELADLIRPAVYADANKPYTNEQFETALTDDLLWVYGLESFIEQRRVSIEEQFEELMILRRIEDITINEFLANNNTFNTDEFGEYDDWIELYNSSTEEIDISGMYLTDNSDYPAKWKLPDESILSARERLIIWADDQPEQGDYHTNFKLNEDGEFVGLYCKDGVIPADSISFGNQLSDVSFGRYPEGTGDWEFMFIPTPNAANVPGNYPPAFSLFNQNPQLPVSTGPVNVTADIWDDVSIVSASLLYSTGAGYITVDMYDNGANGDGAAGDGVYGCYIPATVGGTSVVYYLEATDDQAVSSRFPEDPLLIEYESDFEVPQLYINEFLSINNTVNQDPQGDFDDWIEVYNAGTEPVDIGGMYLTDNLDNFDAWWQIPTYDSGTTTIQPGGFLLLWADRDPRDGVLHLDFRLDGDNEEIGIFAFLGTSPVDTKAFGYQAADISYGRNPDGAETWIYFASPTPGFSNSGMLSTPGNVILNITEEIVNISWDSVTGASYYSVYSAADPYSTFSLEATGIGVTNWSEPVGSSTKFYYIKAGD